MPIFLMLVMISSTALASNINHQVDTREGAMKNSINTFEGTGNGFYTQYYPTTPFAITGLSEANPVNGEKTTTAYFSNDVERQRPNGEMGISNKEWTYDSSNNVLDSGKLSPLHMSIGIDSNQNILNPLNVVFNYENYEYRPGQVDRGTSSDTMITINENDLRFVGWYDEKISQSNFQQYQAQSLSNNAFVVPSMSSCEEIANYNCFMDGKDLFLPLCEDANCSSSDHNSFVQIGNAVQSNNAGLWAMHSDVTDKNLVVELGLPTLYNETDEWGKIMYRDGGSNEWLEFTPGNMITSRYIEIGFIYDQSYFTSKCEQSSTDADKRTWCIMPHDFVMQSPQAELLDTSTGINTRAQINTTVLWPSNTNSAILSFEVDHSTVNVNDPTNFTADYLVLDPSVAYTSNANNLTYFRNGVFDGHSSGWKAGVDRDGGNIYGYGQSAGDGFAFQWEEDNWYTSPLYDDLGFVDKTGDWGKMKVGDGWCGSGYTESAGCRVQGMGSGSFGFGIGGHWNMPADSGLASLPLIDSTSDFDGLVYDMEISKSAFMADSSAGGWDQGSIEIGLQALGYAPIGSSAGSYSGLGDLVGGEGGWYENCFNGYLDVYMVPQFDFDNWYGHATYGFPYSPTGMGMGGSGTYAGQATPYDNVNPGDYSNINWEIAPDGDWGPDEYWYEEIGSSNNDFSLNSDSGHDGHTDGPEYWSMDKDDADYWGHPYMSSTGVFNRGADMKVNPFHGERTEDGENIDDRELERIGVEPVYTGYRAPGAYNEAYLDGTYDSSFNHQYDFWDINAYPDTSGYDNSGNPTGMYDSSVGSIQSDGSFKPRSALGDYHLQTVRLGSDLADFCYDPISNTGIARNNASGLAIEPDQNQLLQHNSVKGQSVLNIAIDNNDPGVYWSEFGYAQRSTTTQLVQNGWLESSTDTTIGFTMMVDIRGITGPNEAVCWGDWSTATDEFDGNAGDWQLYNPNQLIGQGSTPYLWPQSDRSSFCLDENGADWNYGDGVPFSEYIGDTPCLSDRPASGSQLGQNPDQGFWCGLNLISPDSSEPMITLKFASAPHVEPVDSDLDGVSDDNDDCPGTPAGATVDENGCESTTPLPPYGGYNDYDGDSVADIMDRCDLQNGYSNGYYDDWPWYTITNHTIYLNSNPKPPVDSFGCPYYNYGILPPGGSGQNETNNGGNLECTTSQRDIGIWGWEDNDGDGLIDEDWSVDGIDQDGDGLDGEDPFDDCEDDGIDLIADVAFVGRLETTISQNFDGIYRPTNGHLLTAENGTGDVSELYDANVEDYLLSKQITTINNTQAMSNHFIQTDNFRNVALQCNWNGPRIGNVLPIMQASLYVWIADSALQQVSGNQNINTTGIHYSDITNPIGSYLDPSGTGATGRYMPYGHFDEDNGANSRNSHGWSYELSNQFKVKYATPSVSANEVILEPTLAEGTYKFLCTAQIGNSMNSGQAYTTSAFTTHTFTALETCPDGNAPNPPTAYYGVCEDGSGGGGNVFVDQTENAFTAIFDSVITLAIILIGFAIGALAWFTERRGLALSVGLLSVGVGLSYLVSTGELSGDAESIIRYVGWGGIIIGSTLSASRIGLIAQLFTQIGLFLYLLYGVLNMDSSDYPLLDMPFAFYIILLIITFITSISLAANAGNIKTGIDRLDEFYDDVAEITYSEF